MAANQSSVTITATLLDGVSATARKIAAGMGAIGKAAQQANAASASSAAATNSVSAATRKATTQTQNYNVAMNGLSKSLTDGNKKLLEWSDTLGDKVSQAAKRGIQALELLGAAAVATAVKGADQFQRSTLSIEGYTGASRQASAGIARELRDLSNPVSFGGITSGYQSLLASGLDTKQAMSMTKTATDISAFQQDSGAGFSALTGALGRVAEMQRVDSRTARTFYQSAGIDIYGMLAEHTGIDRKQIRSVLDTGGTYEVPWLLKAFQDPASDSFLKKFIGGRERRANSTISGAFGEVRKSASTAITNLVANDDGTGLFDRLPGGMKPSDVAKNVSDFIAKNGPSVIAFIGKLGQQLPLLEVPLKHLWDAVQPLGPVFVQLTQAVIPIAAHVIDVTAGLVQLATPIAKFIGWASQFDLVRKGLADIFVALVAYKTLSTVTGVIEGLLATLNRLKTLSSPAATPGAAGGPGVATGGLGMTLATATITIASAALTIEAIKKTVDTVQTTLKVDKAEKQDFKVQDDAGLRADAQEMAKHPTSRLRQFSRRFLGGHSPEENLTAEIARRRKAGDRSLDDITTGNWGHIEIKTPKTPAAHAAGKSPSRTPGHGGDPRYHLKVPKGKAPAAATATAGPDGAAPMNGGLVTFAQTVNINAPLTGEQANAVRGSVEQAARDAIEAYKTNRDSRGSITVR